MQEISNIVDCYNKTAGKYAEKFLNELDEKPLDRILLQAFADQNLQRGQLIDLGCGPGHTTKFMYDHGFVNVVGTDIASEMVRVAKANHPPIAFEQANLLKLKYKNSSFGSALAFYSIVNFDYSQVQMALKEISRILVTDGELLLAFHAGNEIIQLTEFLGESVDIKFQLFDTNRIKAILNGSGFRVIDLIKREPYATEHQTERAYLWVKKG